MPRLASIILTLILSSTFCFFIPSFTHADSTPVCASGYELITRAAPATGQVCRFIGTPVGTTPQFGPIVTRDQLDAAQARCGAGETASIAYAGSRAGINCVDASGAIASRASSVGASASATTPVPARCTSTSWWEIDTFLHCLWRSLLSDVGAALIYLSMLALITAGGLFDWAVSQTIVNLGPYLFSGPLSEGIVTGWTAFRDVSNIAIIGMFVFIAINIILGNSTYGDKRLIATVIVVATLINFSFLFTKIIINVSGAVSAQIYYSTRMSIAPAGTASGETDAVARMAKNGPATTLIEMMGIKSFENTSEMLFKVSTETRYGWIAFGYGLFAAIIILAAALVFLYGSLILLARAVLFVFLLVTASLAFATHLIPSLSSGKFGWSAWWGTLLRNAALAPIFMLLLWVTMSIAKGIGSKATEITAGATGALGGVATEPYNLANINALFSYLIILGMLFATIKISASLSSSIGGFSIAQGASLTPFAALARYGLAPIGRNIGGRYFAMQAERTGSRISDLKKELARAPKDSPQAMQLQRDLANLYKKQEKQKTRSKGSFDAMNVLGKGGAALGLSKILTEKSKTNYADSVHHAAEEAAKAAASAAPSSSDAKKMASEDHKPMIDAVKAERESGEALIEAAKKVAETRKGDLPEQLKQAQDIIRDATTNQARAIDSERAGSINATERDMQLRAEDARIAAARTQIASVKPQIDLHDAPVRDAQARLKAVNEKEKELEKSIKKSADAYLRNGQENAAGVGKNLARGAFSRALYNATGINVTDTHLLHEAEHLTTKKIGSKVLEEQEAVRLGALKSAGVTPAVSSAAAPSATPHP